MSDLILLQPDVRSQAVLRAALEDHFLLSRCQTWRELERSARRCDPLGCLLDIFDPRLPIPLSTLRRFRRKHPFVALIIGSDFTGKELELYHLGRANVDGVIRLEDNPTPREIRKEIRGALASSLAERVVQTVTRDLPPLAQEAVRWAIEHAADRPQVSDLASALALNPRSFLREMKTMAMAPPRTLLLWGRLIHASHLLERLHETVEGVAFGLGYASGGALRKALKRHVGCNPTILLKRGGLAWTLEEFRRKGLRRGSGGKNRWAHAGSPRWRISPFARRPS